MRYQSVNLQNNKNTHPKMKENRDCEGVGCISDDTEVLIRDEASSDISNDENSELTFGTLDDLFEDVGPCGRYQYMQLFALCILSIPMKYPVLIMYFTGHSPNWRCVNGTNLHCNITGEISPAEVDLFNSRCNMPRDSWEYVTPRNFSFITEV